MPTAGRTSSPTYSNVSPMRVFSPSRRSSTTATVTASRCRTTSATSRTGLADAEAFEPRQHLVAKIRKLVEIVDEVHTDARKSGRTIVGQLARHAVRIADARVRTVTGNLPETRVTG